MRIAIFGVNKRPQVDSQNTGRDAYARPLSVANVSVNGFGGFANFRSLSPVSPTGFNRAFTALTSITGQGNGLNTNPLLEPLVDSSNGPKGPQF
jgi:hypothetical protein